MNKPMKSVLAVSLMAIAAATAQAEERPRVDLNGTQPNRITTPGITYNYVGARYMFQSIDSDYECDQDGINLYGSLDITDGFFAKASFSDVSGDNDCGSNSFLAGAGYHTALNERVDMYATLSFASVSKGDNDSGLEIAGGIRTFLNDKLEGGVELFHNTYGLEDTGVRGGLNYWFNEDWSLTGDLSLSSDATTFGIGARYAF